MTTNNKVKARQSAAYALFAALIIAVFSGLNAAAASARENSGSKSKPATEAKAKEMNNNELRCQVSGGNAKIITMTNNSAKVITAGTKINFDRETGVYRQIALRSDLEPGKTIIIHSGVFTGSTCRCNLIQN